MITLRVWIASILKKWVSIIDVPIEIPRTIDPLDEAALVIVREYEPFRTSGEWKRHQVYAKLIKRFPGRKKYDISFSIEKAIQEIRNA